MGFDQVDASDREKPLAVKDVEHRVCTRRGAGCSGARWATCATHRGLAPSVGSGRGDRLAIQTVVSEETP